MPAANRSTGPLGQNSHWKGDRTICATCGATLPGQLVKDGIRRCRRCRKAKPGYPAAVRVRCATCPDGQVLESRWRTGYRRCEACVAKTPGSWITRARLPKPAPPQRSVVHRAIKPQPKVTRANTLPDIGSWWVNASRQTLNEEADKRFAVNKPRLVLDHGAAFDVD